MQSQIQSQIQSLVAEKIESEQTQKTNLEEKSHHKHHVAKKHNKKARNHHKKGHQQHSHSLLETSEVKTAAAPVKVVAPTPKPAPKAHNLLSTKATN